VSDQDARKIEEGFSYFTSKDLQNLRRGNAIVRSDRSEDDFNLEIQPPTQSPEVHFKEEILSQSRAKYGTPLAEVELYLQESFNLETDRKEKIESTPSSRPTKKQEVIKGGAEVEDPVLTSLPLLEGLTLPETSKEKTLHRYTQMLIKKMAESRGFVASIEKQLENGGKVDVSLENNGLRIACEICSTTTKEWELHNIEKCFDAGYHHVISCSTDPKVLEKIKKLASETLDTSSKEKVLFLEPAEVVSFLDSFQSEAPRDEKRIKGYRVKVNYESISPQEMKSKKEAIAKEVVDSIRKLNKNK